MALTPKMIAINDTTKNQDTLFRFVNWCTACKYSATFSTVFNKSIFLNSEVVWTLNSGKNIHMLTK